MKEDRQLELLMDIQARVVRIETKLETHSALELEVKKHGEEILKAKTSLKMINWMVGFLFFSVPAAVAAIVKIYKA